TALRDGAAEGPAGQRGDRAGATAARRRAGAEPDPDLADRLHAAAPAAGRPGAGALRGAGARAAAGPPARRGHAARAAALRRARGLPPPRDRPPTPGGDP